MSLNMPDIVVAIALIIDTLKQLNIPYQIGGSVASSAHGLPRLTIDADIVADLKLEHVQPLVRDLEAVVDRLGLDRFSLFAPIDFSAAETGSE